MTRKTAIAADEPDDGAEEVTEILVDAPEPEPHPSLDVDRSPVGDPDHPHWQGHTHNFPLRARRDGTKVCRECGFVLTPDPEVH
jgi:hypothetical protein